MTEAEAGSGVVVVDIGAELVAAFEKELLVGQGWEPDQVQVDVNATIMVRKLGAGLPHLAPYKQTTSSGVFRDPCSTCRVRLRTPCFWMRWLRMRARLWRRGPL